MREEEKHKNIKKGRTDRERGRGGGDEGGEGKGREGGRGENTNIRTYG